MKTEFLKQFENSSDFSAFLNEPHKKGVEMLLESELDAHLGYNKHEKNDPPNARNEKIKKTIKTSYGAQ